jgi:preprotein translocase subunit YajC
MKKKAFTILVISLIIFVACLFFLFRGENRQNKNRAQPLQKGESANFTEVTGEISSIKKDYIIINFIDNQIDEKKEENSSAKEPKELRLGINGATPVFILDDDLKLERISQMAELKWDDYVSVQYDEATKEVKKIVILRNSENTTAR